MFLKHTPSLIISPSCAHACTFNAVLSAAPAQIWPQQMTTKKTVTSSLLNLPVLSLMVHINHAKLPCTQCTPSFTHTHTPSTCGANGAPSPADGFLMAKLEHAADGSPRLLQPAMQLMVPLMTKALGVWRGGGVQCVGVRDSRALMVYCGVFFFLSALLIYLLCFPFKSFVFWQTYHHSLLK